MSKRFQITAIAVALAVASGSSFADESGAFFINGNLGQSSYNSGTVTSNHAFGTTVRGGYSWYSEAWDFGVEAGYADLGTVRGPVRIDGITFNESSKAEGPLLGINLKYKFANQWFVSGRVGYLRTMVDSSVSGLGSSDLRGGGGYGGLAVGYDFRRHFSLALAYDNYRIRSRIADIDFAGNVGMSSLFVEYRF
ncbi:MAG: outer membrane beta-barrel protein [Rhodanobacter sp.]